MESDIVKGCVWSFSRLCALAVALGSPAFGAAIFSNVTGDLVLTRFITPSGEVDDVRGAGAFSVSNPTFVGDLIYADSTGGTDPGFLAPLPFGNFLVLAANSALTQEAILEFDFNPDHFSFSDNTITILAQGGPVSPIPVTDPVLASVIGPLSFTFQASTSTPENGDFVNTYVFTTGGSTVPEPATLYLGIAGLATVAYLASRRARLA